MYPSTSFPSQCIRFFGICVFAIVFTFSNCTRFVWRLAAHSHDCKINFSRLIRVFCIIRGRLRASLTIAFNVWRFLAQFELNALYKFINCHSHGLRHPMSLNPPNWLWLHVYTFEAMIQPDIRLQCEAPEYWNDGQFVYHFVSVVNWARIRDKGERAVRIKTTIQFMDVHPFRDTGAAFFCSSSEMNNDGWSTPSPTWNYHTRSHTNGVFGYTCNLSFFGA